MVSGWHIRRWLGGWEHEELRESPSGRREAGHTLHLAAQGLGPGSLPGSEWTSVPSTPSSAWWLLISAGGAAIASAVRPGLHGPSLISLLLDVAICYLNSIAQGRIVHTQALLDIGRNRREYQDCIALDSVAFPPLFSRGHLRHKCHTVYINNWGYIKKQL